MFNIVNLDIWSQYSGQLVCYTQKGIAIVKYNLDPKNINFTRSKTSRLTLLIRCQPSCLFMVFKTQRLNDHICVAYFHIWQFNEIEFNQLL